MACTEPSHADLYVENHKVRAAFAAERAKRMAVQLELDRANRELARLHNRRMRG